MGGDGARGQQLLYQDEREELRQASASLVYDVELVDEEYEDDEGNV